MWLFRSLFKSINFIGFIIFVSTYRKPVAFIINATLTVPSYEPSCHNLKILSNKSIRFISLDRALEVEKVSKHYRVFINNTSSSNPYWGAEDREVRAGWTSRFQVQHLESKKKENKDDDNDRDDLCRLHKNPHVEILNHVALPLSNKVRIPTSIQLRMDPAGPLAKIFKNIFFV